MEAPSYYPVYVWDTNLHSRGSDDVKGANNTGHKVHDFGEALLPDAPGAVNDEHHICFGTFANWGKKTSQEGVLKSTGQISGSITNTSRENSYCLWAEEHESWKSATKRPRNNGVMGPYIPINQSFTDLKNTGTTSKEHLVTRRKVNSC